MRRLAVIFVTLLAMVGCRLAPMAPQTPGVGLMPGGGVVAARPISPDVSVLSGRVVWPDGQRLTQAASMADVASASTVSLINTSTNVTVGTAVTDSNGRFLLSGLNPTSGIYYLEAMKGLNSNRPGSFALRVRTIIQFNQVWSSLTHTAIGGSLTISPETTAVAIGVALRNGNPTALDLSTFMGKVSGSTYETVSGFSQADFTAVCDLVNQSLNTDQDPVAGIGLTLPDSWGKVNQTGGTLTFSSIAPTSGAIGSVVNIQGYGFVSSTPASNSIFFNAASASATSGDLTSLAVTVPAGATSGQTKVQVGNTLALGPLFTVTTSLTGFAPANGVAGTSVTLNGSGFDLTSLANNTVQFCGESASVSATVTAVSANSLTVTVPSGALSGRISVTVSGSTGTTPSGFNVTPVVSSFSRTNVIVNDSLTLSGTGFSPTLLSNTVRFNATAATVLSASANSLQVKVPSLTVGSTGSISVRVGAQTGVSSASYTVVSPTLFMGPTHPLVAGGILSLEGNFGGSVMVSFPGGTSAPATLLGSNRAEVAIPAGATSGNLGVSMTIGGTSVNPTTKVPFRKLGYGLGLQGFSSTFDQADAGRGARLNVARFNHASVVTADRQATPTGDFVYVMGGTSNGTTPLNTTAYAKLHGDGTLSNFTAGNALQTARNLPASSAVWGTASYVYVLGGLNGTALNSVERATITSTTGALGTFSTIATALNTARYGHAALVIGNYLYVLGGHDGTNALGSLERSATSVAGILGAFSNVPDVSLLTPRSQFSTAVIGNYLYVFGGRDGAGAPLSSVERAPIYGDGTLGAFASVGTLATARYGHTTFLSGSSVYAVGGTTNGSSAMTSVEQATINADGSIGAFAVSASTPLTSSRFGHSGVISGASYYAVGGSGDGASALDTLERTSLNSSGIVGSFAIAAGTLRTAVNYAASVVIGNYLYVIGGQNGAGVAVNAIDRAPIAADGTLGAFAAYTTLAAARYGHSLAIVGNYLYVLGGTATGTTGVTTTERFTITWSTGVIGSRTTSSALKVKRWGGSAVVAGSNLYLLGGTSNGTSAVPAINTVEQATITWPAGTLGAFATASIPLGTPRFYPQSAVVGDAVYMLGGTTDGATMLASVERSPIVAGALTAFTPHVNSLQTARAAFTTAVVGSNLYVCGGRLAGGVNTTSIEQAPLTGAGPGAFAPYANSLSAGRDSHLGAVSSNYFYLLGGASGTSIDRALLQ